MQTQMQMQKLNENLLQQINTIIEPMGFECIELVFVRAKEKILRLYIDRLEVDPQTPIVSVEDCEQVSRSLDFLESELEGAFTLEVSSPGLDRPLRFLKHFVRFLGQKVQVQLTEKVENRWKGVGTLLRAEDDNITLNTEQGEWIFPLDKLQRANLVYEWNSNN